MDCDHPRTLTARSSSFSDLTSKLFEHILRREPAFGFLNVLMLAASGV